MSVHLATRGASMRSRLLVLSAAIVLAAAPDAAVHAQSPQAAAAGAFVPPPDTQYDWIQLTSDEWLKGELKGLYAYSLEFDSDKLDLRVFDWEDVKSIRTAHAQAVRYTGPGGNADLRTAYGVLTMAGERATIGTGPAAIEISRAQIVNIAPGSTHELDYWSGHFMLGGNVRSGNSSGADVSFGAKLQRRRAESRFVAEYQANYSSAEGVQTNNNQRLNSYFDSFLTAHTYWRLMYAEYFRDTFQNISGQLSAGTAMGHDLIHNPKTEWDVGAGLGVLRKRYVSVPAGVDPQETSPALLLSTHLDTDLTSSLEYLFDLRMLFVNERAGSYIQHLSTTLSSDLTHNLDLDLTLQWDRVAKPQPRSDGSVPDKDDFRLIVSIDYEF
jgi:Protein of unknown function, DUF481